MPQVRRFGSADVEEIACKSVLNPVRGMPFPWSINPYQGCAHQCVFCYARSTHRYRELDGVGAWGTRLTAKVNAPQVLRAELTRPAWHNEHVAIGTATDPYQSIERHYRITRGIIAELARAGTPGHLITRSPLILRDLDLLTALAHRAAFSVCVSLPTLDAALARRIEPTVAAPRARLRAVAALTQAGIRVGVAVAPVLPHLTDDRSALERVLRAAAEAGASFAWHGVLNLGEITRESYFAYLATDHPELVAAYAAIYRSRYAPSSYTRSVAARVESARRGITFSPPASIQPDAARELRLW